MKTYYVYILASYSKALYIGVTNNLERRLYQHKAKSNSASFTARYNVNRLVHIESFNDVRDAIAREKQLKGWRREKKIALIEQQNSDWNDLSKPWD